MNLILFWLGEVFPGAAEESKQAFCDALRGDAGEEVRASVRFGPEDFRVAHALQVLGAESGEELRIGVINVGVGRAKVFWSADANGDRPLAAGAEGAFLRFDIGKLVVAPPRPRVDLLLAFPRPQVLKWLLPVVTQMGVTRIIITSSTLVPRTYWMSRKKSGLTHKVFYDQLIFGMQQGAYPQLPDVVFEPKLKAYLEGKMDEEYPADRWARLLCDLGDFPSIREGIDEVLGRGSGGAKRARREEGGEPGAEQSGAQGSIDGVLLAIGPERGWTIQEQELFQARGVGVVSMGPPILRTDVACIASIGIAGERLRELMATGAHAPAAAAAQEEGERVLLAAPPLVLPEEKDLK